MPIQPEPILRAALRWLELIPESGENRARSLLSTSARYADLTPTQYESAFIWVQASGLLDRRANELHVPPQVLIYGQAVSEATWFLDADLLVVSPAELPLDAAESAEALGIDPMAAFQHLKARWGKVDTSLREAIGTAGETALVEYLRTTLRPGTSVDHVAEWADGLGYDVAVSGPELTAHIEVKSTTRPGRMTFFLSRNEYEVSRSDPHWMLVLVRLTDSLALAKVETVSTHWIANSVPKDSNTSTRWESARFNADSGSRSLGIPRLSPLLVVNEPPLGHD